MKRDGYRPGIKPRTSRWSWRKKAVLTFALLSSLAAFSGCQTFSYYRQAMKGQLEIVSKRQSIPSLLENTNLDVKLRNKLLHILALRDFAGTNLDLPPEKHYLKYADLGRPYVVWNVHASPATSLKQKTWWYPVVGKLKYRGYFNEGVALKYGETLAEDQMDVYVEGVEAYSTLGWFTDPVLNTFISRSDIDLADLIFHELTHQKLFLSGDTDFNEAFATAVAQEGVRRWLESRGDPVAFEKYRLAKRRRDEFVTLVLKARNRLKVLYVEENDESPETRFEGAELDRVLKGKEEIIAELKRDYEKMKSGAWEGYSGYDRWFSKSINNAQLNTVSTYYRLVPGFTRMLESCHHDLPQFFQAAKRFRKLKKDERHRLIAEGKFPP